MTAIPPDSELSAPRDRPPGVSPVQVGRDAELALLRSVVAAPPALVVIEGEAGIGKSRLVRELVATYAGRGTILLGHCQQLHDPFPLGPVLDAFQHQADRIDATDLSPLVGSLAPLVPELADRLPPPPPPLEDQHEARYRIFRAAAELIRHLTPAVLILEDLHWADTATFDFLSLLAAHQPPGLSVVITTRTETGALATGEAFARAPAGPARVIALAPLKASEVGELARHILLEDIPERTALALSEVTGGVPFVVEEVLRTLLERHPAADIPSRPEEIAALSVSTALRDVVRQRLADLDPVAREILDVAAIADLTVDPEVIADVTGHDLRQVASALGAAQAAGLLHDPDGRSRFRHVLAQQIVYDAVPTPTRRWLHLRVAQVLEERSDPKPSARIAHHYHRAGRTAEFVQHAESAADQALAHGNDAAAAEFLLGAVAVTGLPLEDRLRLATKLGRAAVDGLAHAEAVPILTRLLSADDLQPAARGELRFALGRLHRQQGQALEGYREIERAVDDLAERPDLQARALAVLASPETVIDQSIDAHLARCDQAEEAARRAGSPEVDVAVRIARASLLLEKGQPDAWRLIETVRHDGILLAHPREHARAAINWAQGALHLGHVQRADALLAEGRSIADRAESLRLVEVYELVGALADHAAGRWDGLAERAQDLAARTFGFGAASFDARLLNGLMLAATGDARDATDHLATLVADCEHVGAVWPLVPARAALARLLLSAGDADGGVAHAEAAVDQSRRKGVWAWATDAMVCLVDAAVTSDRLDEVRPVVAEFAARLTDVDAPAAVAALRICEAVVARSDGDTVRAETLLTSARQTAADAGLRYREAQAAERLGDWRCARGSADGAALLEDALGIYGSLSARRDIARITRSMRHHGVPVPHPWRGGRQAHGSDLSRREQEVARLAGAGHTNREIAAELFLSPRTVETHISHALRKLGLRSRDEIQTRLEPNRTG